jgi:uncharacterized phage-associated protein
MKSYDSILVAQYLLSLAREKKLNLNVTKVQKMLYIVFGYFLSQFDKKIIEESPRAWPFGPVFPRAQNKVDYTNILPINSPEFSEIKKDIELTKVLNEVLDKYSQYTASQLTEWSHQKGSPWSKTTEEIGFRWNTPIKEEYINEYFKNLNVL